MWKKETDKRKSKKKLQWAGSERKKERKCERNRQTK